MNNECIQPSKIMVSLAAVACVMTAFAKPAVEPPKLKGARMPQVVAPEHATRSWPVRPLADSGQKTDTTPVFGEDSDYVRNPQSYKDNGDGTVTDNVTGLMWTKADGGENTWEAYVTYCDQLTLAGHNDWRLPDAEEAYTLIDISASPFNAVFTANRDAKYFWTMNRQADGDDKRWEVNQGGGTGAHLKNLTISAGGNRSFHGRCVREPSPSKRVKEHFVDNKDGTVTDNGNGLVWMQTEAGEMAWENAIKYCENLLLAGKDDWRLPDIKELKSISDYTLYSPAIDMGYFPGLKVTYHWSSSATRQEKPRWYLNFESGLTAYTENLDDPLDVKCVRAGTTISK